MRDPRTPWLDSEIKLITHLFHQSYTDKQIASLFKSHPTGSVRAKRQSLGLIHKSVNEFPPSPSLSYVLGVLLKSEKPKVGCDGFTYEAIDHRDNTRLYNVKLSVKDLDFAETFRDNLCHVLKRKKLKVRIYRGVHQVYTSCANFVRWIKSLTIQEYCSVALVHPKEFLRGVYDSEGYPLGTIYNRYGKPTMFTAEVRIGMCDKKLLTIVKDALRLLSIPSHLGLSRCKGDATSFGKINFDYYVLTVRNPLLFRRISFSIARKQRRLEDVCFIVSNFKPHKARIREWLRLYKRGKNGCWIRR